MPVSLLCFLPLVSFEILPNGYVVWKELVILRVECVIGKMFYVLSFLPGVYVGTFNLIASLPGPSILTLN